MPWFNVDDTPNWDWNKVLRHWVSSDPFRPGVDYVTTEASIAEYYRVKYSVAEWIKPKSITEIGVRAGYSAAAFLQAGHTEIFNAIDYDDGSNGGILGFCQTHARNTIETYNVKLNFRVPCNSQLLTVLPDGPSDLLHVDGDHTYEGCFHDMELGLRSGCKWILVDDFDFIKSCGRAAVDCAKHWKAEELYYVYDGGYRGNMLLRNPTV